MGALRQHENEGHLCPVCLERTRKFGHDAKGRQKRICVDAGCNYMFVEELYIKK